MKAFLASSISLLVGLAIGWYVGHRCYEKHVTNEALQQMLDTGESSDREHAARAVRAIEMIQMGKSGDAVELLSRPVADYYHLHAGLTHNDERTKGVLAMIEGLASTNAAVADAIHAKIQ